MIDSEALAVARAEARQYREAMSHHRQIAEHYRNFLISIVEGHVWPRHQAQKALETVPEWDGVLHA